MKNNALLKSIFGIIPFKKEIFKFLKLFYTPSSNIYQHLHFKGIFNAKVNDTTFLKIVHTGNIEENEIFWKGIYNGWEKKSISIWAELCRNADVIFDIGANTGIYALLAKSINPQANVHAFEPISGVYDILEQNNNINHFDIHSHQIGLSDYDGKADIYLKKGKDFAYSVTVNKNTLAQNELADKIEIKVNKLSSIILNNNITKIDLMKIDVETHEPEVLKGMGEYLMRFKPTIIIEVLDDEIAKQLNIIFQNMNYLYFNIDDNKNTIRQVEKLTKSDYWNFLICNETTAKMLKLI